MQMVEKISDPAAAIWNSISDTHYGYICVSATFRENMASPNQIIWIGIRSHFSRRIWIWSQKFQIQPVGSIVSIFLTNNIQISYYAITMDATIKITYWTSYWMQWTCVYILNKYQKFYYKYHITDYTRMSITVELWDK